MAGSKGRDGLIGLLLVLAVASAALAIHAGNQAVRHLGPRSLQQAANGDIWVYQDGELLIASGQGELRKRVNLDLPGPVNSMAPLPSEDGDVRMLVAGIKSAEWLVMDGDGRVVSRMKPSGTDLPIHETFHLATDDQGRIAMGTAGDHRVLLFDPAGRYLAQSAPGLFRYANGLWFEAGRWRVTDTNHGQVRTLDGDSLAAVAAVPVPTVGAARFPALGRQGGAPGHMIVGTMHNDMERGRVIEVAADGTLVREFISRAAHPKPTDFLWLEEGLLLAERDTFSLQLFDREGHYLRDWGDVRLAAILEPAREARQRWSWVLRLAQGLAILCGVIAIGTYLATKSGSATGAASADDPRFSRLATPCLSAGDELLQTFKLYWLPIAVVAGAVLLGELALPGLATQVGALHPPGPPSPGLLVVIGLLPIVTLVVLMPLMTRYQARRLAEPRFEAALASRWVRWFRNSTQGLAVLGDEEKVLEILALTTTLQFPAFHRQVWVLTDRRLLIFSVEIGGGARLLDGLPRGGLRARVEPAAGWLARLGGRWRISLRVPDGQAFSGYPGSPVTARRLADFVQRQGVQRAPAAGRSRPVCAAGGPRPHVAFLMSLVVPGLGQFLQGRFVPGLVLLGGMLVLIAAVVTPVLLGWIGHHYDVPLTIGVPSLLMPVVWALLAARDAGEFARR
jgi:hypothetical protein